MPAFDVPLPQNDEPNDAEANSDEVRMRQALEKLGTRSTPPVCKPAQVWDPEELCLSNAVWR